jgi:hypothetical protein
MVAVTLPDGSVKAFEGVVTPLQVAEAIGPGLAKAAVAAKVNGRLVDLTYPITEDANVAIVTERDPEGLEVIRHSTAHLLAHAVKELYPEAQVTIGPVIENGFYYDFAFPRPFTPEDLERIEERMKALAAQQIPVVREEWDRDEAIRFFRDQGEYYKAEIIASIPLERIGVAMHATNSCSASTERRGPTKKRSMRTSNNWKRQRSAIIAAWGFSSTSSISRTWRPARSSGIRKGGASSRSSSAICASGSSKRAISRSTRRT